MFELDFRSRKPIYEQICERVKEQIAMGELRLGQQLPAVRTLAKEIGINHNTIQKAFSQLEREGVINTVAGKGSFVNPDQANIGMIKEQALQDISHTIEKNMIYNITFDEVVRIVEKVFLKGMEEGKAGG